VTKNQTRNCLALSGPDLRLCPIPAQSWSLKT